MSHLPGQTYSLAELERYCVARGYDAEAAALRRYRAMRAGTPPTATRQARRADLADWNHHAQFRELLA